MWSGSNDSFKKMLDDYLATIPDQPEMPDRKPGGRTFLGAPSNNIADWARTLGGNDDNDDDTDDKSRADDDVSATDGEDISIRMCDTSSVGSGLSPDHS